MCPNLYSNIIPAHKVKIGMMTCIINISWSHVVFSLQNEISNKMKTEHDTFTFSKNRYYPKKIQSLGEGPCCP